MSASNDAVSMAVPENVTTVKGEMENGKYTLDEVLAEKPPELDSVEPAAPVDVTSAQTPLF